MNYTLQTSKRLQKRLFIFKLNNKHKKNLHGFEVFFTDMAKIFDLINGIFGAFGKLNQAIDCFFVCCN